MDWHKSFYPGCYEARQQIEEIQRRTASFVRFIAPYCWEIASWRMLLVFNFHVWACPPFGNTLCPGRVKRHYACKCQVPIDIGFKQTECAFFLHVILMG